MLITLDGIDGTEEDHSLWKAADVNLWTGMELNF